MSAPLPPSPFLYPIVDVAALRGRGVAETVDALASAGVSLLQLRAKETPDRTLLALAREAVGAARRRGVRLIVNDRADVALMAGADGVHVGQDDLPVADARRIVGPHALVGLSTHDLAQLEAAAGAEADYLAIGPVFSTGSKANPDPVVGLEMVARARAMTDRPLVAIGGITHANARDVVKAGADGIAVIGDLFAGGDPGRAAARLLEALRS